MAALDSAAWVWAVDLAALDSAAWVWAGSISALELVVSVPEQESDLVPGSGLVPEQESVALDLAVWVWVVWVWMEDLILMVVISTPMVQADFSTLMALVDTVTGIIPADGITNTMKTWKDDEWKR